MLKTFLLFCLDGVQVLYTLEGTNVYHLPQTQRNMLGDDRVRVRFLSSDNQRITTNLKMKKFITISDSTFHLTLNFWVFVITHISLSILHRFLFFIFVGFFGGGRRTFKIPFNFNAFETQAAITFALNNNYSKAEIFLFQAKVNNICKEPHKIPLTSIRNHRWATQSFKSTSLFREWHVWKCNV